MRKSFDVIVVGAGFTGLAAARELERQGLSALVLEAQARVGGRVKGGRNGLGEPCDLGGQFLCDEMTALLDLIREQGGTLVEPPAQGALRAQPSSWDYCQANDDPAAAAFARGAHLFAALRGGEASADETLSLGQWIDSLTEPEAVKAALRSLLECIFCRSLADIPLWHVIKHGARSRIRRGEMQYLVAESLHSVAVGLAGRREAEKDGPDLRLSCPVTRVSWKPNGAAEGSTLEAGGETWHAREVLLALPPVMLPKIDFSPGLPRDLLRALGAYRQGDVIKLLIRYPTAFWRERGWCGTVQWSLPSGLYCGDASPSLARPQLVAFIGGPLGRDWHGLSLEALRARVLPLLAAALGPEAENPLDFQAQSWVDDPWSGGGYSASIVEASARDAEALLRSGSPPLNFACSELAKVFPGYVEGALHAGRDAAIGIARRLGVGGA